MKRALDVIRVLFPCVFDLFNSKKLILNEILDTRCDCLKDRPFSIVLSYFFKFLDICKCLFI